MPVLILVVTAIAVFVIAAVTIGREARRLDNVAPAPAFELVDAVDWIANQLPEEVSARISYADVRDIVTWHLQYLEDGGVRQEFGGNDTLVIVEDSSAVAALHARAISEGRDLEPVEIQAVLDGELSYLQAIGAVGPLADPTAEL